MGFFQKLFGKASANPEEEAKRQFVTLRDDGLRAQHIREFPYAEQCFRKALELQNDLSVQGFLAEVLYAQMKYADAIAPLETLLRAQPDNLNALLLLADCQGKTAQYDAQAITADAILTHFPEEARGYYFAALAAQGRADFSAVQNALSKALEIEPNFQSARLLRAQICAKMGQSDDVLQETEKLLKLDDANEDYLLLRADAFAALGEKSKAETCYFQLQLLNPFNALAILHLGALYEANNQLDKALKLYNDTLDLRPDYHEVLAQRAALKLRLDDKEGAEADRLKSLEMAADLQREKPGDFSNVENEMNARYKAQNPYGF